MNTTTQCLTKDDLRALIEGRGDDQLLADWTIHIEECDRCRAALQSMATGEVPVEVLVRNTHELSPPNQSAYWPAVEQIHSQMTQELQAYPRNTPQQVESLVDTKSGLDSKGNTPAPHIPTELEFLEPSDDPAYLGRLSHFQVARVMGRGGMGIVLEAFDTHLQRSVAIKVLNPQFQENEVARQRFCREGRAAAAINHEHVVAMHEVAKLDNNKVAYLVMQLIEGETLEDRIQASSGIEPAEVTRIGMQIASGLAAAHKQGMVHRDIKPANVLIEKDTDRVKLTDFGLARAADDVKLTKTGMVTGTPLYMSPEQTLGESADERSDLFSLGVVLYEMVTGISPFQAPSALGVMKKIVDERPTAPISMHGSIPKALSDLIMSLMEKNRADRPESAAIVSAALATLGQTLGSVSPMQIPAITPAEIGRISGGYSRVTKRYAIAAWLAGIVAAVSLVFAFIVTRDRTGDSVPSIVLPDNPGTVWSIDFSEDGSHVLAAIEDGTVRSWNVAEQRLEKSFHAHRGIIWMVCYAPDGQSMATSGDDGFVKIWDADTFELLAKFDADSAVRGLAFSPDGTRVAAGNREGVAFVIDAKTGEVLEQSTHPGSILGVDYSNDGKLIAIGGSDRVVRLLDAQSLEVRQTLEGHGGPIYNLSFANQSPLLASVGWNKHVMLWNTATGQLQQKLDGSEGDVWGVSFCGDDSHLVTGEQLGSARVWDVATGEDCVLLHGHTSAVHNVSLDPSAHRIATSSRDGTVRVWDMSSLVE